MTDKIIKSQRFGKLTAFEVSTRPNGWTCICDCGAVIEHVEEKHLLSGEVNECAFCTCRNVRKLHGLPKKSSKFNP